MGFQSDERNNFEEAVILGVDGGATSTVCVCLPLRPLCEHRHLPDPLPVIGRAAAGCSNHNSVGAQAARKTLEHVINKALSTAGKNHSAVFAVCLGVSGVNHPSDQERVLNWMRDMFPGAVKIYVKTDAVAALASGTMGKLHGCVLIAGTGCIAYGFTEDGREARAAGAGPVLGDWGRWTYADSSWARIAALVPLVVSCAESGDQVAHEILTNAVQELASSVIAVVRRLYLAGEDGSDSFHVVIVGGVFEANKRWDIGKEVIDLILKAYPGACPIRPKAEPAIGAALFAWNSFMEETEANGHRKQKGICVFDCSRSMIEI
ncbi:hypothetical protein OROGR_002917 [Orobanche gracilis]